MAIINEQLKNQQILQEIDEIHMLIQLESRK